MRDVRPGLFYSARCAPMHSSTHKSIVGAVTFQLKDKNQFYTLAFEDPINDYNHKDSYKGHI